MGGALVGGVAIVVKDLEQLWRDRALLAVSLLAPVAMITVITLARSGSAGAPRPTIVVVDEDKGPVAAAFVELLGKHASVVASDMRTAERTVRDLNRAPAAIVFPPGLSRRYLRGQPSEVTLLTDPAQAVALNTVRALLLVMDRDAAELADPLHEDLLVYREEHLTGAQLSPKSVEQNVPGFTIMFVLLALVLGASAMMHEERAWGTWTRLAIAPGGLAPLVVGKLAVRVLAGFVQAFVLLYWGRLVFGLSLGSSPWALAALTLTLAFAAAALGVLVAAVSATREQTVPWALAITLGLSALCGLWWPLNLAPAYLQTIGKLFFPAWAMFGMTDLILRDRPFSAVLLPLAVMVGQGLATLGIAMALFRRRRA